MSRALTPGYGASAISPNWHLSVLV